MEQQETSTEDKSRLALKTSSQVAAIMFEGLAEVEPFAAGIKKSPRKVREYIENGMPTVCIGRSVYIPIVQARDWLLKHSTRKTEARKPGRPRKAA